MKIVTWNVNSLAVRLPRVLEFVGLHDPDVVLDAARTLRETYRIDQVDAATKVYGVAGDPIAPAASRTSARPRITFNGCSADFPAYCPSHGGAASRR